MTQTSHDTFAAFVGLDWADAQHDGCLQAAGSAQREYFQLAHTPEAIDAWVTTLRTRFHGQPVALCLELTKGPLVSALRKYDFLVLFPINPLTLARYREAFTPSRAKDDPTDAELQLELLLTHRDKLQPLLPQSPTMRALAQLVEHRRRSPRHQFIYTSADACRLCRNGGSLVISTRQFARVQRVFCLYPVYLLAELRFLKHGRLHSAYM